jgi:hypothetical protein
MIMTMRRSKKRSFLATPAIDDVPVDQLGKVIGGYARSPAPATPPGSQIAVIIIAAVA